MTRARHWPALLVVLTTSACGSPTPSGTTSAPTPANNVLPIEVGAGPDGSEVNGAYTSVTICVPGTASCQTISGIEIDTGSIGLRLLASAVNLPLPRIRDGSGNALANCAAFADLSFVWGPIATADVHLAGETASAVPVQLIGAKDLAGAPDSCGQGGPSADTFSALGAAGLLGVGVFRQDCGPACSGSARTPPPVYYACPASGCAPTSVRLDQQLQNPVWLFLRDNNGLLVQLPAVPANGALSVSGSLIFGIGTQPNNGLGSARLQTTDDGGDVSTQFQGATFTNSYFDTGSTALGFSDSTALDVPTCAGGNKDFYCPSSTASYTATVVGRNGVTTSIPFSVANADALLKTPNSVFNDLAGPGGGDFDWGLPFFLGRSVFVGIEGQASPGGIGPYWAY